jgi:predicted kinase
MIASKELRQKMLAVVTQHDSSVADAISRYVEDAFNKVFGTEPVQTISQFVRSKSPFFGATAGKLEALQEKLGQMAVDELKKEISEIEDNMTDNLDIIVESIEQLRTRVDQGTLAAKQALLEQTKDGLRLVATAKWLTTLDELARLKTGYQKLNEVSKSVLKEKNALESLNKNLKDKVAELTVALSEVKERESRNW